MNQQDIKALVKKAYLAGIDRAYGYDSDRIDKEEILEKHQKDDLAALFHVAKPLKLYVYDCDRGQGSVMAKDLTEAREQAKLDCGRNDPPRNVHLATAEEEAFRQAMGGATS